ncbi:MAG: flagellar biosynthesis protein FlgN [Cognatishimia sp.]
MSHDAKEILANLDRLLSQEHAHLLAGNLESFADLLAEKEDLLARLAEIETHQMPNIAPIQSRMHYNQKLLESAMQGIRAVADRLQDLRQVQLGLETYDAGGKRRRLGRRTGRDLEKRA